MTIKCPECGSDNVEINDNGSVIYYSCKDCGYESYEHEDCWEQ